MILLKVTIFGSGYVGLVTGACLAEVGNDVLCVDVNAERIEKLKRSEIPLYEPGLDSLLRRNEQAGRLRFTTDAAAGVAHGLFQLVCVGTPPGDDGSADLSFVMTVARTIGEHMGEYRVIVDKSTVPVGTADKVRGIIRDALADRGVECEFDVVSNPEFLKEGAAVSDFMKPDRIVIGSDSARATELLASLHTPFNRNHDRIVAMDVRSAELTKYAANALLATKISFMNEMASLAELLGADIEHVRVGIGADPRIGYQYIYPGCGYGGSCFPKDVRALENTAREVGYTAELLRAVEAINRRQRQVIFQKVARHFPDLTGRTFAVWGLSFKPNTDDMREAPSRDVIEALWEAGAKVQVHDPEAMTEARHLYGERADLVLCETPMAAVAGADALILMTEWNVFRSPDFPAIKAALKSPVVFDGRNIYDPKTMAREGFTYYAIGRGE